METHNSTIDSETTLTPTGAEIASKYGIDGLSDEEVEARVVELEAIVAPVVIANANRMVSCGRLGGAQMTLGEAVSSIWPPSVKGAMILEGAGSVLAEIQTMLFSQPEEAEEEEKPEKEAPEEEESQDDENADKTEEQPEKEPKSVVEKETGSLDEQETLTAVKDKTVTLETDANADDTGDSTIATESEELVHKNVRRAEKDKESSKKVEKTAKAKSVQEKSDESQILKKPTVAVERHKEDVRTEKLEPVPEPAARNVEAPAADKNEESPPETIIREALPEIEDQIPVEEVWKLESEVEEPEIEEDETAQHGLPTDIFAPFDAEALDSVLAADEITDEETDFYDAEELGLESASEPTEEASIVEVPEPEAVAEAEVTEISLVDEVQQIEETQDVLREMARIMEESEPQEVGAINEVLEKVDEILAAVEVDDEGDIVDEAEVQAELQEVVIELMGTAGIEYAPEMVGPFTRWLIRSYVEEKPTGPGEEDDGPLEYGTNEILTKLLLGLGSLKKTMANAGTIGRSVMTLYTFSFALV